MTQSTPERKPCGTCGNEYTVTANKTIRHHFTDNPEFQSGPDSRKCRGVGEPPAGEGAAQTDGDPQCRLCRHPVQLTGNGRVRSHMTPEATPRTCPGGSDFPLGDYPEITGTTDGLVATLAADCEHVPAGQCYGCWAAEGAESCPDHGDPIECTCRAKSGQAQMMAERQAAPWGVDPDAVAQPTMADQLKATPHVQALARETVGVGTVLDAMDGATRSQAEQFMGASVPAQPAARAEHKYTDPSGVEWVHPGPEEACPTPDCMATRQAGSDVPLMDPYGRIKGGGVYCEQCDTDNHRCPGCGTDVPHGTTACDGCERELLGRKLPPGRTEDGRTCEHHEAMFGVEDGRMVCVACGTPCTHPGGFTDNDPVEDDGEALVFRCPVCGAVETGDGEPSTVDLDPRDVMGQVRRDAAAVRKAEDTAVGPDPTLPNCPTPETHRYGCGCPDDDYAPGQYTPETGPVRLGDLEHGDHFTRRGVPMCVTGAGYGLVEAIVLDGPHTGRTGELTNLDEMVERIPARPTEGLETEECTDDRTPQRRPASSEASTPTTTSRTTAPAAGSRQGTKGSVPAVSPKSASVTSSAPTATAAGNGRSAAVTTDQDTAAAAFLGSGRPSAPSGPANLADAAAQFLAGGSGAHGEKETKRDRYGRYLIPHPDTGREQAWTRATTFAKSISDTYALSQWGLRMALLGATQRPDLVRRAHGKHVRADKRLLDELTAELKNAAGDKVAANLGTSMHSFTEMADRAWHSPGGPRSVLDQIPPDCRGMVETYIRLLEETGLEPVPHLIEFTTVVKQYGVAGTSDNCYKVTKPLTLRIGRGEVHMVPGEYTIGDKKTGRSLDYGWQEIAIQLGTYAQGLNTAGVWDRHEEQWHPDPLSRFDKPGTKVRLDAGIVIHLPVDDESEKTPSVYGVDLESGWNAAVLCERVRTWRKVRNLASPVMVAGAEAETFAPQRTAPEVTTRTSVRPPSLEDRARAVRTKADASVVWRDAKKAGLPAKEVDGLVAVMQSRLRELTEPGG